MNPYEMTFSNTMARMAAWVRGLLKRYRRPLLVVMAATATLAVSVSASQADDPVPPALAAIR